MTYTRTHVSITFADPYLDCTWCKQPVNGWHNPIKCGCDEPVINLPCKHEAGITGVCPSWSPVDGCMCIEHLGNRNHRGPILKEALV